MSDRPVWKTVLSIALTLIGVIKLAITCSQSSNRSSYSDNSYDNPNSLFNRYGSGTYDSKINESESNDLFYESYDSISTLNDSQKADFKVVKVKNDTLVSIDVSSKINVEPTSFIQKNYDDSLQLAVKLPDNTSIFLHSYTSKENMMDNFKAVKKKKNIKNITFKIDEPHSKFINYTYKYEGKKYNGCALLASENGEFTSLEFENNKISKEDLHLKALTFLTQIAK